MLSRRSGQHNNRRHRRTHRRLQVHPLNPVPQPNNLQARPRNRELQDRALRVSRRLPACRQAHRECHQWVRLALLPRDQLFRGQLSLRH